MSDMNNSWACCDESFLNANMKKPCPPSQVVTTHVLTSLLLIYHQSGDLLLWTCNHRLVPPLKKIKKMNTQRASFQGWVVFMWGSWGQWLPGDRVADPQSIHSIGVVRRFVFVWFGLCVACYSFLHVYKIGCELLTSAKSHGHCCNNINDEDFFLGLRRDWYGGTFKRLVMIWICIAL